MNAFLPVAKLLPEMKAANDVFTEADREFMDFAAAESEKIDIQELIAFFEEQSRQQKAGE